MIKISNSLSRTPIGLYGDTKDADSFVRRSESAILNTMDMAAMHALEPLQFASDTGFVYNVGDSGPAKILLNDTDRVWRLIGVDVSWSAVFTGSAFFGIVTIAQIGLNYVLRNLSIAAAGVGVGDGGYAAAYLNDDQWHLVRPGDHVGIVVYQVTGAATPIPQVNAAYINI